VSTSFNLYRSEITCETPRQYTVKASVQDVKVSQVIVKVKKGLPKYLKKTRQGITIFILDGESDLRS